jgi:hypothetical protein
VVFFLFQSCSSRFYIRCTNDMLRMFCICLSHASLYANTINLYEPNTGFRDVLHRELEEQNLAETNPDLHRAYIEFQKDYQRTSVHDWPHERCSLIMIDAILAENGMQIDYDEDVLDGPLAQIGDGIDVRTVGLTNRDFVFIKECIYGGAIPELTKRVGRTQAEKEWLYDVVSNSHSMIDVDKLDYYARDAKRTIGEDDLKDTIIEDAVVARAQCNDVHCSQCYGSPHPAMHFMICYAAKRVHAIHKFFLHRFSMHEQVYQHKTTAGIARMIVDIFGYAEPYFRVKGLPLSLSIVNPESFGMVDDEILTFIEADPNPKLRRAKELIQRYKARKIYKIAGELAIDLDHNNAHSTLWQEARRNPTAIADQICSIEGSYKDALTGEWMAVEPADIIVETSIWHEGRGKTNPLEGVRFVLRDHLQGSIQDEFLTAHQIDLEANPNLVKKAYQKQCIRLYAREPEKKDLIYHKFLAWKESLTNAGEATVLSQLDDDNCDNSERYPNRAPTTMPNRLTQESDSETTPVKSPYGRSPIPNFHILKIPPRSPAF